MNKKGNFFAIDRRVWAQIYSLGRINPAVAYLVMARGTLGDMRTTSWSTNSIEERTGIPRLSAKLSVQTLIDEGFVEKKRGGKRPQYFLRPAEDVLGTRTPRPILSDDHEAVLEKIRTHPEGIVPPKKGGGRTDWPTGNPYQTAFSLAGYGLVRRLASGAFQAVEAVDPAPGADWIWLPNTIVDGAAAEVPPVERIRQSHSLEALRLFVDLYHAQGLSIEGGVNWRKLRETYHRAKVGEWAEFDIYAFWPDQKHVWPNADFTKCYMTGKYDDRTIATGRTVKQDTGFKIFWDALEILTQIKLIEFVPHAVTADTDEGTVIHPLARDGEEAEQELAAAAHAAGSAMLGLHKTGQEYAPEVILLPVQRHIRQISLVGLARLRHRANTTATAAWYERMDEWRQWTARYLAHEEEARGKSDPGAVQYQR